MQELIGDLTPLLLRQVRIEPFSPFRCCGDVRRHTNVNGTLLTIARTGREHAAIGVREPIPNTSRKKLPHRLQKIISC